MQQFSNLVVGGMVAGGLYAMLAAGVVLTYQTSGIFNFAHGAIAFATAFLFFQLNTGLGWPTWLAAVVAIVLFAPMLGLVVDRALFRRIAGASAVVRLVVPLALLVVLPALCLFIVDRLNGWFDAGLPTQDQVLALPGLGPTPKTTWQLQGPLDGVLIDSNQVAVLAAALVSAAALRVMLRHTRLGLQMRAVVDHRSLAELRGIDADRTSAVAWMIGSFLAGLAGVLLAPLFTLNAPTFTTVVLISTPAVVFARFRSIPLAILGGLLMGVMQNLVVGYADFARGISGFRTAVPFIVLFGLLFVFGIDRARVAGSTAEATPAPPPSSSARRQYVVWGVWAAVLLVFVFGFADDYWRSLIARGLALGIVLLSFTIVTGLGGMVSLAQAAFVSVAGFTAGWAISHDWPFLVALAGGTIVAAAVGAMVALPVRRFGGLPLALATMALAFIGQHLVFQLEAVSNTPRGGWVLHPPQIGPFDLSDRGTMIVALLGLSVLASWLVGNLIRSSSGRAMIALRSSEPGAVTVGIHAGRTKVAIFAVSAGLAGFGGVLLASTNGRISNVDFPPEIGFFWLATVVVFGVRRPAGAVLAGLSISVSPEVFGWVSDSPLLPQIMFGLAALNLARNPDGILAMVAEQRHERAARKRRRTDEDVPDAQPVVAAPVDRGSVDDAAPVRSEDHDVLALRNVRAGYGEVEVLHGVDLRLARGSVTAIVGANGAGKTTLCSAIAGTVTATHGSVQIDGVDAAALRPHQRVDAGAVLIPEGRGIFPALTVEENLAVWLPNGDDRANAYARFSALDGRRGQTAGSLSGGEQQMLALAPALVHPPMLLIADEPSLGLAPLMVERVYAALRELRDAGTAVLLVEEKATDVLALSDHVVFLQSGRVGWTARADEVDEARLVESYLGITSSSASPVASTVGQPGASVQGEQ